MVERVGAGQDHVETRKRVVSKVSEESRLPRKKQRERKKEEEEKRRERERKEV